MRAWIAVALVLLAATSPAEARTPRKVCRAECRTAIDVCADAGPRRRVCRARLLRACRRQGVGACVVVTTTSTTVTSTTTTTVATGPVVNGCDPRFATDLRGQTAVTVRFGTAPSELFDYAPECIVVDAGTAVTFRGDFGMHPLVGGEITAGGRQPDPASPFTPPTTSGDSRTFTLATPGVYGYYCDRHWALLMWGAVVVVP